MASSLTDPKPDWWISEIANPEVLDKNDAGALNKALAGIQIGKPATFGGMFRDSKYGRVQYEQFNTHTPPDITANTRIIACLGINQLQANPQKDGWFVSDFFAFWHIFQGTTSSQTWLHCLDFETLVNTHDRYLHGNPYKERKVVLDSRILQRAQSGTFPLTYTKSNALNGAFKRRVTAEAKAAESKKENLLIMLFGHGDAKNHGIVLGTSYNQDLRLRDLVGALKGMDVNVTLLTTSCFSGAWTCSPMLNLSTLTAAGREKRSLSWQESASLGRYCGSMFATAVVESLTRLGSTRETIGELINKDYENAELIEQQNETYSEFTKTIYETLLKDVDRRGMEHGITFGAKDDAWSLCYRERTGIPLINFQLRWDELESWPASERMHPGDPQNRDPHVSQETRDEYAKLRDEAIAKQNQSAVTSHRPVAPVATGSTASTVLGKRKTSGLYGGEDDALRQVVSNVGGCYLASYKDHNDTGTDGALHNTIYRIRIGAETDPFEMERVLRQIQYRMDQMSLADKYLELMSIPAPNNQQCCDFDTNNMERYIQEAKHTEILRSIFDREVLFPSPTEDQGLSFCKGHYYLIAAFNAANTSREEVLKKLDMLAAAVDEDVENVRDVIKNDPEVSSKRQKLYKSFGMILGSMSPSKRLSRS